MDASDDKLIALLRSEPRATNRSLAAKTGLSEPTVASRIARLEQRNELRVMAIVDNTVAGFDHYVVFGVRVADRNPDDVAEDIANIPNVQGLTSTFGRFELVGTTFARDKNELSELLDQTIGMIPGVSDLESSLILETKLFRADIATLSRLSHGAPEALLKHSQLDDLDRGLVMALQENARMSNRSIGRRLSAPEATVRSRLNRLLESKAIRLEAVTDLDAQGSQASAWLALRVGGGALQAVTRQLCKVDTVGYVGTALGRFNVIAVLVQTTRDDLQRTIFEKVAPLRGIQQFEAWEKVRTYKHELRVGHRI